jgi:hypothetical protein
VSGLMEGLSVKFVARDKKSQIFELIFSSSLFYFCYKILGSFSVQ